MREQRQPGFEGGKMTCEKLARRGSHEELGAGLPRAGHGIGVGDS